MSGMEPNRVESEDELLGPDTHAAEPLTNLRDRLGGLRRPLAQRRGLRRAIVSAVVLALFAVAAAASGVAVHSSDVHRAADSARHRVLLRLLGGGAQLALDPSQAFSGGLVAGPGDAGPSPTETVTASGDSTPAAPSDASPSPSETGTTSGDSAPAAPSDAGSASTGTLTVSSAGTGTGIGAFLTIAVRNDGTQDEAVTGAALHSPGVTVAALGHTVTVKPGQAAALTLRATVDCTAADLPRYPDGATLAVRSADGRQTSVTLPFDEGHPSVESGSDSGFGILQGFDPTFSTTSYYELCGKAAVLNPPDVSYVSPIASATVQNPVFSFRMAVTPSSPVPEVVEPMTPLFEVPGLQMSSTLDGPETLSSGGDTVTVTTRVTDCAKLGGFITDVSGLQSAVQFIELAIPLGVDSADPRFRTSPAALERNLGIHDRMANDLLAQIAVACPSLE